jgi:hypothetical protein
VGDEAAQRVERREAPDARRAEVQLERARPRQTTSRPRIRHRSRSGQQLVASARAPLCSASARVRVERRRRNPVASARLREPRPIELLAGIDLAPGRHVGMREDPLRRNSAPRSYVAAQRGDGLHLRRREIGIAVLVAGVLNLDADRQN